MIGPNFDLTLGGYLREKCYITFGRPAHEAFSADSAVALEPGKTTENLD
jgi:hypothetical protein